MQVLNNFFPFCPILDIKGFINKVLREVLKKFLHLQLKSSIMQNEELVLSHS